VTHPARLRRAPLPAGLQGGEEGSTPIPAKPGPSLPAGLQGGEIEVFIR